MTNPSPLEKQLLHMDLSKGLNERGRPETSDPATCMTRVDNLVQDQSGAWVKRPGQALLGGGVVDEDTLTVSPIRLLPLTAGLGVLHNTKMSVYQEGRGKFVWRALVPPLALYEADTVSSSAGTSTSAIYATASSTKFHAVIAAGSLGRTLTIYERASNTVVARYPLAQFVGGTNERVVFVGDRYLHLYYVTAPTGLMGVVLDTEALLPVTLTPVNLVADLLPIDVLDVAVHSDRSFVLYSGTSLDVVAMDNAGAFIESTSAPGATHISNSGTNLWVLDATDLTALDPTSLATVVATGAHGVALTSPSMVATTDNRVIVMDQTAPAFGSTTISQLTFYRTTAAGGTTLDAGYATIRGWVPASCPVAGSDTLAFVHLVKSVSTGIDVAPHVLANITYSLGSGGVSHSGGNEYTSVRIACNLEPFIGNRSVPNLLRYFPYDNGTLSPAVAIQPSGRNFAYSVLTLRYKWYGKTSVQSFGGASYITGGSQIVFGGDRVYEAGFSDLPIVNAAAGAAGGLTGLVRYIAVYKYTDSLGAVTWSRVSEIASINLANTDTDLTICPAYVTNNDLSASERNYPSFSPRGTVGVELYRTQVGGTQYYLCASSQDGASTYPGLSTQAMVLSAGGFFTVTDAMSDATLASQPALHRQPGTPNSAVDRYPPPCSNILCQHKDRLFTTDPYGTRVYYSSFFVDGETAWYNPAFSFFVHGGTGPITAIVSMDGRLFIFKRDGIFVVDGDGPGEAGVTGNEYSPPQKLATSFGCIDHRSVVITSEGIMYRSPRGIELLNRSLKVMPVGERVQTTCDANPYTQAAVIDASGLVHFLVSATATTGSVVTGTGAELVYDTSQDCWSVYKNYTHAGVYGSALQDCVLADLDGLGEVLVYADPATGVRRAASDTWIDADAYYVPWVIETGWMRQGQQARARFSRILGLLKKYAGSNHKVTFSVAFNYVDSYTQVATWQPVSINALAIEELEIQLARQEVMAVRFKMEDGAPADTATYPVGTGRGPDVLGITLEIAVKTGAPKGPAGQKA